VPLGPIYRRPRRWGGGTARWPVFGSAGAIDGVLSARGRRDAVARVEAPHVGERCTGTVAARAAERGASGGRRGTRGTERARARTARRGAGQSGGAGDGRHRAAHGHALRVRVSCGVAGARQAHGLGGVQARGRGRKERRKEGERKKKKKKGKKGRERKKEKERLGKKKRNGREKKKRRERGGASAPITAATAAGRPRARGIRALREEKGIAPALIAAGDRAWAAGHRAARNGTGTRKKRVRSSEKERGQQLEPSVWSV
jgi:hypothetical protein